MAVSTIKMLCNHHDYLVPENTFLTPEGNLVPVGPSFPVLSSPPALGSHLSPFRYLDLPILKLPRKWSRIICGHSYLASFM